MPRGFILVDTGSNNTLESNICPYVVFITSYLGYTWGKAFPVGVPYYLERQSLRDPCTYRIACLMAAVKLALFFSPINLYC